MNNSILALRANRVAAGPLGPCVRLHDPRSSLRAFRAWLNGPARCEPTPSAVGMYGLLLRPADRPDIDGRGQR